VRYVDTADIVYHASIITHRIELSVPSSIEQYVGAARDDLVFIDARDPLIVELVPLLIEEVFAESCVVPTHHCPVMVGDSIKVINYWSLIIVA
jgi:hypothetical protein